MFYRDARVSANCKVFGKKINDSGALRRRAALDKDAGLVVLFDCQIAYMAVDYLETAAAVKADTDRAGAVGVRYDGSSIEDNFGVIAAYVDTLAGAKFATAFQRQGAGGNFEQGYAVVRAIEVYTV